MQKAMKSYGKSAGRFRALSPEPSVNCFGWSGCRDLNPGPPAPQAGALARLRHSPNYLFYRTRTSHSVFRSAIPDC